MEKDRNPVSLTDEVVFFGPHDGFSGCEMPPHVHQTCVRMTGRKIVRDVVNALLQACLDIGMESHVKVGKGLVRLSAGDAVVVDGTTVRPYNWLALRYER